MSHDNFAIDVTRAPLGERAAAELVEAAGNLGDFAERHYLELKGPADLDSKVNRQKVAKFILGAANRTPERAAEAFEGYGVMVIGITNEGVRGIPPIEMLTLSQVVQPFLGAAGPRWDIVRVSVPTTDRQVIVVLVDPPRAGDPIYFCRENGEGLQSGRVYYRADGETREARADEMDQLVARANAVVQAPVDLAVSILGSVTSLRVDNELLEEYIARKREQLLNALPRPVPEEPRLPAVTGLAGAQLAALRAAGQAGALSSMVQTEPEKRTEEQYKSEVDRWTSAFRASWPRAVELFAAHVLDTNEVRVINRSTTFLHGVQITLHLEGAVEALSPEYAANDDPQWRDIGLPKPPRKWGPIVRDWGLNLTNSIDAARAVASSFNGGGVSNETLWTNGGSVDVRVDVGDLRPEATYESADDEAVLVLRGGLIEAVKGTWRATIEGYDRVFAGELQVDVNQSVTVAQLLSDWLARR